MKKVDHLLEFIKGTLNKEEQIYLAAQIQIEIYKSQISPAQVSTNTLAVNNESVAHNVNSNVVAQSVVEPVIERTEHIPLFKSLDGKDIQYAFLLKKAVTSRPKNFTKLRNFISTMCNGYGGLKPSDLDIVMKQLHSEGLYQVDEETLIWNVN